jgi:hypothetical protein
MAMLCPYTGLKTETPTRRFTMKRDVGTLDRLVRISAGLFLLFQGIVGGHGWGYLGVIPLLTGALGWCPLYSLLGISTVCRKCSSNEGLQTEKEGAPR